MKESSLKRGSVAWIAVALAAAIALFAAAAHAEAEGESQDAKASSESEQSEASPASDSPQDMVIDLLAKKYMPVQFSHGYHADMLGDCSTCHHHSPAGETPACGECHQAKPGPKKDDMPFLKAAYHLNCMGCHKEMGAGPTGCTDCHAKKKTESSQGEGGDKK